MADPKPKTRTRRKKTPYVPVQTNESGALVTNDTVGADIHPPTPTPPWDLEDPTLGIWSDKRGNWFHVAGTVWTTTSWAVAEAQLRVIGGGDDWRIRRLVDWLEERGESTPDGG